MTHATPHQQIIQLAAEKYEQYADLPFAVCLLGADGVFLRYNERARQLFELSPSSPNQNVRDFFNYPADHGDLIRQLRAGEPGQWLRESIFDFKINGHIRYVRDVSLAIWNESTAEVIGRISLMSKSNHSARYHQLFSELPVGIFCLRYEEGLTNANAHFLDMHGFTDFTQVQNQPAGFFMNDIVEVKEMEHQVRTEGSIVKRYQEHKRRDGTVFTAAVSAKAIYDKNGRPIGMEGIVEDVSNEDIYFKMVDNVPMGLYKIWINDQDEHILVHCNQQFAEHLGAASPIELIGRDIRPFHRSEESFRHFHDQLIQQDREGRQLVDHIVELVDANGRIRRHEVHSNLLKDAQGNIIGRVGAERDVTDLWETRQQLNELTTDIGKVLHSYSSTLIHSKHSMDAVIRALVTAEEWDIPDRQIDMDRCFEKIRAEAAALQTLLDKVLEKNVELRQIEEAEVENIKRLIQLIQPRKNEFDMRNLALIRDGSIRIKTLVGPLWSHNFPREWLKQTRRHLNEILRLCSLLTLSVGIEAILEMETNVNNLRSYILTRVKPKEPTQRLNVYDLLIGVIKNMTEYASNRQIELRLNAQPIRNVYLDVFETDFLRALSNILHNAVKYSWVRKGPAKAYVQISAKADAEWVDIAIENWGVAITAEEIRQGLVFNVGYRGANAGDRRRPGTGLGLYDAKKVVEKHRGRLRITSEPSLGNPRDDYSKPFVTTVHIQLPRNNRP